MKLKKCPKCGKDVLDDMKICGYCGTELPESRAEEESVPVKSEKEDEINSSKSKISGKMIAIIAAAAIAIVGIVIYQNSDSTKYSKANKLLEKGDFLQAADTFQSISEYKNAQEMYKKCIYEQAKGLMESEDYQGAMDYLEEISDYEDAQGLYKKCIYEQAKIMMESGDYEEAIERFEQIIDFEDSKELSKECTHNIAVLQDKEAPVIEGLEASVDVLCATEFNLKDYIAERISIKDNVTDNITEYSVNSDSDLMDKGSGRINTQKAGIVSATIVAKDEAGNEGSAAIDVNIKPIHVTRENPNPVVYDGEYGKITVVSFNHGDYFGKSSYRIELEFSNRTDKNLVVYLPQTTSINNYQVEAYFTYESVGAGKTGVMESYIDDEKIPESVGDFNQIDSEVCIGNYEDLQAFYSIPIVIDTNVIG